METGLIQGLQSKKYPQGSPLSQADKMQQLEDKKLKDKCNEFQSILYSCMLKSMRSTVKKAGLIDGGHAEDIYTSMLDDEYAKTMSKNAKHSIAETLYQQFKHDKKEIATVHKSPAQGAVTGPGQPKGQNTLR